MFPLCVWVMHHLANIINLIMEVCVCVGVGVEKHEVGGRTEDVSIKTNKNKLSCIAINWYY